MPGAELQTAGGGGGAAGTPSPWPERLLSARTGSLRTPEQQDHLSSAVLRVFCLVTAVTDFCQVI